MNTVAFKKHEVLKKAKKDDVEALHPAESLIIDYLMNLFLMGETEYAL